MPKKMDEFIDGLIRENDIKFQAGNFYTFNFSNHLFPLTSLTVYFHMLKSKYGDSVDAILKNLGERQIKALAEVMLPSSTSPINAEGINFLLKNLCLFGYGDFRIVNYNDTLKEIVFQLINSSFCSMYLKLFGIRKGEVNPFVGGICQGLAELMFNCRMKSKEAECIAKNKESCYIITSKDLGKEPDSILSNYTADMLLKTMKVQKLPSSQTDLIKKIVGHGLIEWKNGTFSVWRIPGYIFPALSVIFLNKALEEKFGKEINSLFYQLGRVQARNAVLVQVQNYGFKKNKKLMLSVLEHSELIGFGISKLEMVDFNKQTLTIKGLYNPYPLCNKEVFGKSNAPVDYYLAGLLAGVAGGIIGVPMEAKETMCTAKGDAYCLYELTKRGSKTNYKIGKKDMQILEENINPKKFIL